MKQQFDLSLWLQDKSRKVVTRDGRPVRIICWDIDSNTPILVAFRLRQDREEVFAYGTDGKSIVCLEYDLFFADEEEELTEFEKELQTIISEASHWTSEDGSISTYCQFGDKEIKKISEQILDLARNELEKEIKDEEYFRLITEHYKQGKQDALKDLPKWRYINQIQSGNHYAHIANGIISPSGYFISYDDLETLPKEEQL